MKDDIAYLHAHDLREMVRNKEISAEELTKHFLQRIEKYNSDYHAYDWVVPQRALEDARRVDKWVAEGKTDLQLLGVPMIIDGGMRLEGTPISYGCVLDVENFPKGDSLDVHLLKKAGAIILGKGNTSEFGLTATTISSYSPQAKNPLNPLYSSGGSSGGVATALAKGLASIGVGPDKNGGMRLPACYCGLTCLKATRGRIPFVREFIHSVINKNLTQISPMSRCIRDLAMVLNVLARDEKEDLERLRVKHGDYEKVCHQLLPKVKIGWIPQFGELPVDRDVAEVCERGVHLIESTGCDIEVVDFDFDVEILQHYCNVYSCEHYVPIVGICEMDRGDARDHLMRGTHHWLNYAKTVSGVNVSAGVNNFSLLRKTFNDLLKKYDLLICPGTTISPLTINDLEVEDTTDGCFKYSLRTLSHLLLNNLTGHPSMVLPSGLSLEGIPVGMNVIANYCDENLLFKFANTLEETFQLHGKCLV